MGQMDGMRENIDGEDKWDRGKRTSMGQMDRMGENIDGEDKRDKNKEGMTRDGVDRRGVI